MSYSIGKGGQVTYTSSARRLGMAAPMTRNGPGIAGYVNIAADWKGSGGIPSTPKARKPRRRKAG